MSFMLSASGMSLSNKLSSVLLKVSHLVARYTIPLIVCFIHYFMLSTSSGSPLKESIRGLTLFRSHLSKFLSTVGRIFQIFCPLEVQFFTFIRPFLAKFVSFVCFRTITITKGDMSTLGRRK